MRKSRRLHVLPPDWSMMNTMTKRSICLLIISALVFLFGGCSGSVEEITYHMPEDGIWYCEELGIEIVLDRENGTVKPSTVVINGETITCICVGEFNTPYLFLRCQDTDASKYKLAESIYWWTVIEYTENELVLEDYYSKQCYDFVRTE